MTDPFLDPIPDVSHVDDVTDPYPDVSPPYEPAPYDVLTDPDNTQSDFRAGQPHWHLTAEHNAVDTNANGLSDSVETQMGLDPTSDNGPASDILGLTGIDSDLDGWPDDIEVSLGTDPTGPDDFPMLVESHHFPEGSEQNLSGTYDVPLPPVP